MNNDGFDTEYAEFYDFTRTYNEDGKSESKEKSSKTVEQISTKTGEKEWEDCDLEGEDEELEEV